ncbi:hypothetical protein GIB67_005662 [Kingdonia uniflora]|uniref:Uncharacterized protein n=1 Tax=Kingdonia uniflora TaxID=39325 RepID=A0A7J7NHY4_9MAGN|nr:hypothetical protein GIB67_005662 [Kingdonia uniflora]
MDKESQVNVQHDLLDRETKRKNNLQGSFLFFNCALLGVGSIVAPLLVRLYFVRGGARIWLSSWLQTAGFRYCFSLFYSLTSIDVKIVQKGKVKPYFFTRRLFITSAIIGVLGEVASYLYASGAGKVPVSTSTLLLSTQLAFVADFTFIIVKQKVTSYSLNSVVLLTVASLILGLHANGDRPNHESDKMYYAGFSMTLGAAALVGFNFPLIELMYMKAKQKVTYYLVMEMQLVICIFATAFSTVGMLVNKDFQV